MLRTLLSASGKHACEIHLGSMVLQVGDTQRIDEVCGVEIKGKYEWITSTHTTGKEIQ
ncbi:MAG: hypothetical protein K5798_03140 [Nitrosopumilus sp.]|uniref:hypothetical protein n=1 Tax=Nitrosopumilus sp. TaxID=2024843 RepID=UPI002431E640|nr:hypothetical protein [Nitrosopumilus sp.]MCV0366245.1 hypothetical protein [Nitrosopumilus sp.]